MAEGFAPQLQQQQVVGNFHKREALRLTRDVVFLEEPHLKVLQVLEPPPSHSYDLVEQRLLEKHYNKTMENALQRAKEIEWILNKLFGRQQCDSEIPYGHKKQRHYDSQFSNTQPVSERKSLPRRAEETGCQNLNTSRTHATTSSKALWTEEFSPVAMNCTQQQKCIISTSEVPQRSESNICRPTMRKCSANICCSPRLGRNVRETSRCEHIQPTPFCRLLSKTRNRSNCKTIRKRRHFTGNEIYEKSIREAATKITELSDSIHKLWLTQKRDGFTTLKRKQWRNTRRLPGTQKINRVRKNRILSRPKIGPVSKEDIEGFLEQAIHMQTTPGSRINGPITQLNSPARTTTANPVSPFQISAPSAEPTSPFIVATFVTTTETTTEMVGADSTRFDQTGRFVTDWDQRFDETPSVDENNTTESQDFQNMPIFETETPLHYTREFSSGIEKFGSQKSTIASTLPPELKKYESLARATEEILNFLHRQGILQGDFSGIVYKTLLLSSERPHCRPSSTTTSVPTSFGPPEDEIEDIAKARPSLVTEFQRLQQRIEELRERSSSFAMTTSSATVSSEKTTTEEELEFSTSMTSSTQRRSRRCTHLQSASVPLLLSPKKWDLGFTNFINKACE